MRALFPGLLLVGALSLAPPAAADDASDFQAVAADYAPDQDVTSCAFTKERLEGARRQAVALNAYGGLGRFISEVDVEIARWDSGFCAGVAQRAPAGSPAADFETVFEDWRRDGDIADCRYTSQQLQNALGEASKIADIDAYLPGFRDELGRELARNASGACAAKLPGAGLRIVKVRAKGGPRKEYVTIKNTSRGTVGLKGLTLRDRSNHRIKFPSKLKLKRGKSLRVVSGCFKQRKRATKRRSRLYACKAKQLWNDKGDVVKLVNSRGKVIAQRGYGRFRRVARF